MRDRDVLLNQRNRILRGEDTDSQVQPQTRDFTPEAIHIADIAKTQYSAFLGVGFDSETAVYLTAKLLRNLI
jgi:hypothetical protein